MMWKNTFLRIVECHERSNETPALFCGDPEEQELRVEAVNACIRHINELFGEIQVDDESEIDDA
jgi:hypothetical protein